MILFLIILSYSAFSQKQYKENINGFGIFLINETNIGIINKIKSQVKSSNYDSFISNITDKESVLSRLFKFNIIEKNHYCPDLQVWEISTYYIDDIKLTNIKLSFYKNILFEFSCDYTNSLISGLIYKFGEGNYSHGDERDYDYPETGFSLVHYSEHIWENEKVKIKAFTSYSKNFIRWCDDKLIQKGTSRYFYMRSKIMNYKELEKCENIIKESTLKEGGLAKKPL